MRITTVLIFLWITGFLMAVTIYDVQYTTNAGTGTYPSPFSGTTVTLQGIVTATGYNGTNSGFYIEQPEGGAWKGLLIYTSTYVPTVGSLVQVTGLITEYYGLTEMKSLTAYQVISTGNAVPAPVVVTSTQIASSEAYEGVLVKVAGASVTQTVNTSGDWAINDGSGGCTVSDLFFNPSTLGTLISLDNQVSVTGIVNYSYSIFSLNPRSSADVVLAFQPVTVSLPTLSVDSGTVVTIPVTVTDIASANQYSSYGFNLSYDPSILSYNGQTTSGTLSASGVLSVNATSGNLAVRYTSTSQITGQGTLMNLLFKAIAVGQTPITLSSYFFNTTAISRLTQGSVTVNRTSGEVLDTLTVIQRPLINIPAIVIPNETFTIECVAPLTTTGWNAQLKKGAQTYALPVTASRYEQNPPRWIVTVRCPTVNVYELYDLYITASGGISDRTRHSVHVVPTRKTNYYFAQVTDVHMPTHILSPSTGYDTDSTETVDLREVIRDINLIRPEFVLLTGDLVNEGELEDYNNLRVYTKGKRLLGEFEVPVFMVTGNHDISGWQTTPPVAGSARKFWWRNFGWSWLNNTSTSWSYHTQDYSFDYGLIHFIGMEAYNNSGSYDNYLPAIYGSNSFTATQMQWLQADIAASSATRKVLFEHYDFSGQINPSTLGVNMVLGGHTHQDSGSLTTQPYNLLTDNVCDGARAYRIIRVTGTDLLPYATINAGSSGEKITVSFIPANYGFADSISATVTNSQVLGFENALVKFNMPVGTDTYSVIGGTLEQVDRSGTTNVCYVRINLNAGSTMTVSIRALRNVIPLEPGQLQITSNPTSRTITWNPVTSGTNGSPVTVDHYLVEGSTDPVAGFAPLGTVTVPMFADAVHDEIRYFYRVKAITTTK